MTDFDREAEREKLREKYERDERKREATEQMSELLLQGATMTDRHCPECHSPVFRHDGREFCPTCQREVTEEGELAGEDGADAATDADSGAQTPPDAAANGQSPAPTEGGAAPEETGAPAEPAAGERAPTDSDAVERAPADEPASPRTEPAVEPSADRTPSTPERSAGSTRRTTPTTDGDLGEAEAVLVDEIADLTRRAAETRDVQRKRDLLAAAREATETLRELRRV